MLTSTFSLTDMSRVSAPSSSAGTCLPPHLAPIVHGVAGLKRWYDSFAQRRRNENAATRPARFCGFRSDDPGID
jgi:hypothetical protein